jgi:hypothetical protein
MKQETIFALTCVIKYTFYLFNSIFIFIFPMMFLYSFSDYTVNFQNGSFYSNDFNYVFTSDTCNLTGRTLVIATLNTWYTPIRLSILMYALYIVISTNIFSEW